MNTLPSTTDSPPLDRRRILALIALIDQLPVPETISFLPPDRLALRLKTVIDAFQWAVWFGASAIGSLRPLNGEPTNIDHSPIVWHGWTVELLSADQTAVPTLDPDTRARLEQVADVAPETGDLA
jgi:hypothetical protein